MNPGWKKTTDDGLSDPACHMWDGVVADEVSGYNRRLKNTPGYVVVDPTLVLAMLWVESNGPKKREWYARVMQFGNTFGKKVDGGLPALHNRDGATREIVSAEVLAEIDAAWSDRRKLDDPKVNIRGGIAYLFVKMALSEEGSIVDGSTLLHHVISAKKAETSWSVAQSDGTTLEDLKQSNPGVNLNKLHDGQDLMFHKAHVGRKILGWRVFDVPTVAKAYNAGGDAEYEQKLYYVLSKLSNEGEKVDNVWEPDHFSGGGFGGGGGGSW